MAEKSSASSDALRKLEEQLTCSICLDYYINPKTLPCFHPFCQQCLEGLPLDLQGKKRFLSCPTCRTPTELPEAGVVGFPVAFLINNLTEVHSLLKGSGDQHVSCDNCKKNDATGHCKQCSKFYCAKCLGVHNDWVTFVDHTVIGLDEVTRTALQPPEQLYSTLEIMKSKKIKDVHKSIEEVTNSKVLCKPENGGIYTDKVQRAIVIYNYEPKTEGDLLLEVGQTVEIISEYESGWCLGRVNGMEGFIPGNFVKKLDIEDEEVVKQQAHRKRKTTDFEVVTIRTTNHDDLKEKSTGLFSAGMPILKMDSGLEKVPPTKTIYQSLLSADDGGGVLNHNKSEENATICSEKKHELQKSEWFFCKMKRSIAEKKLLQIGNKPGTFLIREDEIHSEKYMLSIRDIKVVKHYRIHKVDSSGYYLLPHAKFSSLDDLVKYYQSNSDGLCSCLTVSCRKGFVIEWEIERCSIHIVKRLHVGEFSEVWEGIWNDTTVAAVKIFKTGTMPAQEFLAEAEVMKKLRHPKVLRLFAVCTREEPIYIITELMTKGDLLNYLQQGEGRHLKLPTLIDIGAQVAHGMDYLESQRYIHRNLAARNVLVGDGNIAKIADFGMALFINNDEYCTEETANYRCAIKWAAPEAFLKRFTIKSDVWSFGILLYELVTHGGVPYPGMKNNEVRTAIQREYRMPIAKDCPEPLYKIMLDCWNEEPERRPTFEYLHYTLEDFFNINVL